MTSKQDHFIAWSLIFQAVVGGAILVWIFVQAGLPLSSWIVLAPLVLGALAAGVGSLCQYRWAAILGILVFAAQIPIISTPYLNFYAWLVFHIKVSATWGQATFGVNLVGLGFFIWAAVRYGAPNKSFKPTR